MPIDREVREICTKAARRFEELGCIVEEASPDIGAADEAFHILRGQHFIVDRELQLRSHRDKLKPDIIWNTERGLAQTPSDIARAERERAAFYRRMVEFFETYDLLVTPGRADAGLRRQPAQRRRRSAAQKLDNYMGGSTADGGDHAHGLPRDGRAVRLRPIRPAGRPAARRQAARRGGAAAGRVALRKAGRPRQLLPIDPKPGTVPPSRSHKTGGNMRVVITGASRGIGRATARKLAADDARR